MSAWKRLHQCEITHSTYANVRALACSNVTSLVTSNILTKPSTRNQRSTLKYDVNQFSEQPEAQTLESSLNADISMVDFEEMEFFMESSYLTDATTNSGIAYVANIIEQKLLTSSEIYCFDCVEVLKAAPKVDDKLCINLNNGKPCLSTYQICKLTDIALKSIVNTGSNFKQRIFHYVLNNLQWENIFPAFHTHEHDFEHKQFIIKFIIDDYVNRKCNYIAKQKTMDLQKRYIRNKLKKLCHYYHQLCSL